MTKRQAKKETLLVWRYLAENPKIRVKGALPLEIYTIIKDYFARCPLCEYKVTTYRFGIDCSGCPLENVNACDCYLYSQWAHAKTNKERAEAAQVIVDKVSVW
jgi:hypothetical protein